MKKGLIYLMILGGIVFLTSCNNTDTNTGSEQIEIENMKTQNEIFFTTILEGDYDSILNKVVEAYADSKFGLINNIDFQAKLFEKLGEENVDLMRYHILGICNPGYAYKAIQEESNIGVMLPCKVVVKEIGENKVEIATLNPAAVMGLLENEKLTQVANDVTEILRKVIEEL